jgi:hypothetical protein
MVISSIYHTKRLAMPGVSWLDHNTRHVRAATIFMAILTIHLTYHTIQLKSVVASLSAPYFYIIFKVKNLKGL